MAAIYLYCGDNTVEVQYKGEVHKLSLNQLYDKVKSEEWDILELKAKTLNGAFTNIYGITVIAVDNVHKINKITTKSGRAVTCEDYGRFLCDDGEVIYSKSTYKLLGHSVVITDKTTDKVISIDRIGYLGMLYGVYTDDNYIAVNDIVCLTGMEVEP